MKSKLSMILFVLILGSTLTTALVSVDYVTKGPIARNKAEKLQKSVLSAFGIPYTKESIISELFPENIKTHELNEEEIYYEAKSSGDIAFEINGMGLWGPIKGIVALDENLQKIQGFSIIHQEETPGLGGRIAEPEFLTRFKGINITEGLRIQSPGKVQADNEVHGITGATLSCKALEEILNDEIKSYVAKIEDSK